jgi:hypothetical protein
MFRQHEEAVSGRQVEDLHNTEVRQQGDQIMGRSNGE